MKVKNLIVGAGPTGITIAERLAAKGEDVLIIEKRAHIGGNCYDYYDANGILVHKYGPHIFHTNFEDVWRYLHQFSEFTNYQHKVLGYVDGNRVPIPFNLHSLYTCFSPEYAQNIEKSLLQYFDFGQKVSIIELKEKAAETGDKNLLFIADYVFEKIFKNYTIKQRQITPDKIDQNVLKRVPLLINKDDRYFPWHKYQGMPKEGYTTMFKKMLDSPHISVLLNTDYKKVINEISYERLFFTGPIDEFFDYKYGKLDYKKTAYKLDTLPTKVFQQVAQHNYPNDYEFTRITEMKHFYPEKPSFQSTNTVVCYEYPGIGDIEAYPVEIPENIAIFEKYKADASALSNVFFLGRLANYKYQDMDVTYKNALDFFTKLYG